MKTPVRSKTLALALMASAAVAVVQVGLPQEPRPVAGQVHRGVSPPGDLAKHVSPYWITYECPDDNGRDCTVSVRQLVNGVPTDWLMHRYAIPPGGTRSVSRALVLDSVGHSNR